MYTYFIHFRVLEDTTGCFTSAFLHIFSSREEFNVGPKILKDWEHLLGVSRQVVQDSFEFLEAIQLIEKVNYKL